MESLESLQAVLSRQLRQFLDEWQVLINRQDATYQDYTLLRYKIRRACDSLDRLAEQISMRKVA